MGYIQKILRNEHICRPHQVENAITEVVMPLRLRLFYHVTIRPLKSTSHKSAKMISQIRDREADNSRNGLPSGEKSLDSLSLSQSAKHQTVVIDRLDTARDGNSISQVSYLQSLGAERVWCDQYFVICLK